MSIVKIHQLDLNELIINKIILELPSKKMVSRRLKMVLLDKEEASLAKEKAELERERFQLFNAAATLESEMLALERGEAQRLRETTKPSNETSKGYMEDGVCSINLDSCQ